MKTEDEPSKLQESTFQLFHSYLDQHIRFHILQPSILLSVQFKGTKLFHGRMSLVIIGKLHDLDAQVIYVSWYQILFRYACTKLALLISADDDDHELEA